MRTTLFIAIALALASTGCIQNMADFKDRLGATSEQAVTPADVDEPATPTPAVDAPKPTKPPVARISIFGPSGALVFKSSFVAEDPAEPLMVEKGSKLNLIGSDSEGVETGSTITSFAWTLNGSALPGARQADLELGGAGLYQLSLVVTDSHGKTDAQLVKLGVAPDPFEETTEIMSGPVVAANVDAGDPVDTPFELAIPGSDPAKITAITIVATAPTACDIILEFVAADGTSLGSADEKATNSVDGTETLTLGETAVGSYLIRLAPFACVAPNGLEIRVTVTYLPIIEGLGGDAHGGHGH